MALPVAMPWSIVAAIRALSVSFCTTRPERLLPSDPVANGSKASTTSPRFTCNWNDNTDSLKRLWSTICSVAHRTHEMTSKMTTVRAVRQPTT